MSEITTIYGPDGHPLSQVNGNGTIPLRREMLPEGDRFDAIYEDTGWQEEFLFQRGTRNLLRDITEGAGGNITTGPDGNLVSFRSPLNPLHISHYQRLLMRLSPVIRVGLSARKAPVQHAFTQWRIESRDPVQRAFIRAALEPILADSVKSGLRALDFGAAPHEKLFEQRNLEFEVETGENQSRTQTIRNAIVPRRMKDLDPSLVTYQLGPKGEFEGLKFREDFVPADKSWVVTNEMEFGDIRGKSVLDACWEPWYWWTVNVLFLNRYMERRGSPHIKAWAPQNIKSKDGTQTSSINIMAAILEGLYDGGVAVLPYEVDDSGNKKWDFEYVRDDARAEMFLAWIEHLEILILLSMLIPDSVLITPRREGSRALAEVRERIYTVISGLDVGDFEKHYNRFVIPQIQEINFGPGQPKATLKAEIRPTDRTGVILQLIIALIRAKDAPQAQRFGAMLAVKSLLEELGVSTNPDDFRPEREIAVDQSQDSSNNEQDT